MALHPNFENMKEQKTVHRDFALTKENYKLLAIGFVVIIIGFILMSGGGSTDEYRFSEDIYSFRRTTLAPMVVLAGFVFEVYAIMKKTKADD